MYILKQFISADEFLKPTLLLFFDLRFVVFTNRSCIILFEM